MESQVGRVRRVQKKGGWEEEDCYGRVLIKNSSSETSCNQKREENGCYRN